MKDYHEYPKECIGSSDYATLILAGPNKGELCHELHFGKDEDYQAYIVDAEAEIGEHYTLEQTFKSWMKIYDDTELVKSFEGKQIKVYRAGEMGCIIQILN